MSTDATAELDAVWTPQAEDIVSNQRGIEIVTPMSGCIVASRRGHKNPNVNGDYFGVFNTDRTVHLIVSDGREHPGDEAGRQSSVNLVAEAEKALKFSGEPMNHAADVIVNIWDHQNDARLHDGTLAIASFDKDKNELQYASLGSTLVLLYDNHTESFTVLSHPPLTLVGEPMDVMTASDAHYQECFSLLCNCRTSDEAVQAGSELGLAREMITRLWDGRSYSALMNQRYKPHMSSGTVSVQSGDIIVIVGDGVAGLENLTLPKLQELFRERIARATPLNVLAKECIAAVEDPAVNSRYTSDDQTILCYRVPQNYPDF